MEITHLHLLAIVYNASNSLFNDFAGQLPWLFPVKHFQKQVKLSISPKRSPQDLPTHELIPLMLLLLQAGKDSLQLVIEQRQRAPWTGCLQGGGCVGCP